MISSIRVWYILAKFRQQELQVISIWYSETVSEQLGEHIFQQTVNSDCCFILVLFGTIKNLLTQLWLSNVYTMSCHYLMKHTIVILFLIWDRVLPVLCILSYFTGKLHHCDFGLVRYLLVKIPIHNEAEYIVKMCYDMSEIPIIKFQGVII